MMLDSSLKSPGGWSGQLRGNSLIVAILVVSATLVAVTWMAMTYERVYALGPIFGFLVVKLGTLCNALARGGGRDGH